MKLTQKHLLKGFQEFELVDDYVRVRSKARFRAEEELAVMLSILNPEPEITRSSLNFTSRVNGDVLLSLQLGKPDTESFNAFVNTVKQRAMDEYQAFAGLKSVRPPEALAGNVHEAPPDFAHEGEEQGPRVRDDLDAARIEEAIRMLTTYLNADDIRPFLAALEALQAEPRSATLQVRVVSSFNELGPAQGAVLTYAPYVGILLSDGPAGSPY